MTDKVKIVNPKYITRKSSIWILEYEFESPVKGLIIYSVERQPAYGKNYYGSYLPRDVIR